MVGKLFPSRLMDLGWILFSPEVGGGCLRSRVMKISWKRRFEAPVFLFELKLMVFSSEDSLQEILEAGTTPVGRE
jgi:hypothetical protein